MITTERLLLLPTSLDMLDAMVDENWPRLSTLLGGADFAENWFHFPEAFVWMRDFARDNPDLDLSWWNYLILHKKHHRMIGTCGYKGAPGLDGKVEIGYEIAATYQQQGFATEAARGLCAHAFGAEAVTAVTANTLAEENPSVRLLRTLGFTFTGEHIDLEDGAIWSWELPRLPSQRA
jgi:[ribosomal protein S5]-alanine N-acetyltransferase